MEIALCLAQVHEFQQTLERALSKIADENIDVVCAGRTDTGVNATNQVVQVLSTTC